MEAAPTQATNCSIQSMWNQARFYVLRITLEDFLIYNLCYGGSVNVAH